MESTYFAQADPPTGGQLSVCESPASGAVSSYPQPRCTSSTTETLFVCRASCVVVTWSNVTSGILASANATVSLVGASTTYNSTVTTFPTQRLVQVCTTDGSMFSGNYSVDLVLTDLTGQPLRLGPLHFISDTSPPTPTSLSLLGQPFLPSTVLCSTQTGAERP